MRERGGEGMTVSLCEGACGLAVGGSEAETEVEVAAAAVSARVAGCAPDHAPLTAAGAHSLARRTRASSLPVGINRFWRDAVSLLLLLVRRR